MSKYDIRLKLITLIIALSLAFGTIVSAESIEYKLNEWLVNGPTPVFLPAFKTKTDNALFKYVFEQNRYNFADLTPSAGDESLIPLPFKTKTTWEVKKGDSIAIGEFSSESYQETYAVCYLNVKEFIKGDIKLKSNSSLKIFYDGKEIGKI